MLLLLLLADCRLHSITVLSLFLLDYTIIIIRDINNTILEEDTEQHGRQEDLWD